MHVGHIHIVNVMIDWFDSDKLIEPANAPYDASHGISASSWASIAHLVAADASYGELPITQSSSILYPHSPPHSQHATLPLCHLLHTQEVGYHTMRWIAAERVLTVRICQLRRETDAKTPTKLDIFMRGQYMHMQRWHAVMPVGGKCMPSERHQHKFSSLMRWSSSSQSMWTAAAMCVVAAMSCVRQKTYAKNLNIISFSCPMRIRMCALNDEDVLVLPQIFEYNLCHICFDKTLGVWGRGGPQQSEWCVKY